MHSWGYFDKLSAITDKIIRYTTIIGLVLWCLTPLSAIVQLYHGG